MKDAWKALRPAEWAVVAFLAFSTSYVFFTQGLVSTNAFRVVLDERARRVFAALLIVGTVHLVIATARHARTVPERQRVAMNVALGLALLPTLLGAWAHSFEPSWSRWGTMPADDKLHYASMAALRVLGVGAPFLGVWAWLRLAFQSADGPVSVRALGPRALRELGSTLREWAPVVYFIPAYSWMESVIGDPSRDFDGVMQRLDGLLFLGKQPVYLLESVIWEPLSEWLAFSYSFYAIAWPLCLGAIFATGGAKALREGVTALSLGLCVTYICYALIPVKGPALSMPFTVSLDLYFIKEVKEMLMDRSRITYDCFPSFHTAGMLLMGWLCFRHVRRLFWVVAPMVVCTPLACVYLRYHYATDVLAGALLAGVLAWATPKLLARWPAPG